MVTSTVGTKGQVVIPAKIREKYHFKNGTKVAFIENGDEVILKPFDKTYFQKFVGILKRKGDLLKELMKEKEYEKLR